MIKLPKHIVVYPQKKSVPGYLLCWIPAQEYPRVVADVALRDDHERFDPQGIEIELSKEGLEEAGVELGTTAEELRRAYLALLELSLVPDNGMVELVDLQEFLAEEGRLAEDLDEEPLFSFDRPGEEEGERRKGRLRQALGDDLARKIAGGPPMSEGEEASQVYRRLDVKQRPTNQDE